MNTLPDSSLALMREVARSMVDPGGGVPEARLDWTMAQIREFARASGPRTRLALRFCLFFAQWLAPLLVLGRAARFTSLDAAHRAELLEKMESGRFVLLFVPLKAFICMNYFEHPDALAETGYDGRPLIEAASAEAPRAQEAGR